MNGHIGIEDTIRTKADLAWYWAYGRLMIERAIADLGSDEYRDEARDWLWTEQCKEFCEALGLDHKMVASTKYVRGAGRRPWVAEHTEASA